MWVMWQWNLEYEPIPTIHQLPHSVDSGYSGSVTLDSIARAGSIAFILSITRKTASVNELCTHFSHTRHRSIAIPVAPTNPTLRPASPSAVSPPRPASPRTASRPCGSPLVPVASLLSPTPALWAEDDDFTNERTTDASTDEEGEKQGGEEEGKGKVGGIPEETVREIVDRRGIGEFDARIPCPNWLEQPAVQDRPNLPM